jgi:hypothetical protein
MHDTKKLPKWAQQMLANRDEKVERLEREKKRLEKAHDVLKEREWFTIPNPVDGNGPDYLSLFVLIINHAQPVCSIGKGDHLDAASPVV